MKPGEARGFTIRLSPVARVIRSECHIGLPLDTAAPETPPPDPDKKFVAIWDTGATGSVITQRVVDACGLQPTGMVQVHGIHGPKLSNTFLVTIYLPNKVAVFPVKVTQGDITGADVLIGMDIISKGDFVISNHGSTVVCFRIPSIETIDFGQAKASGVPSKPSLESMGKVGRNAPCPCGSRKKYKRCCGMGVS